MFYLYKLYRITLIFAIQQPTSTNANMNIAQPYLLIKNQSCKHHSIFAKLLYLEQKKIMQHSMFKMMVNVEWSHWKYLSENLFLTVNCS